MFFSIFIKFKPAEMHEMMRNRRYKISCYADTGLLVFEASDIVIKERKSISLTGRVGLSVGPIVGPSVQLA